MNYRHAYHAGGTADVFKHAALTLLLGHLKKKDGPFAVIDSHAGVGRYDLTADPAMKTGEAADGIFKLMRAGSSDPLLAPYLAAVAAANPDGADVRFYPGSPVIVRGLLRPRDRLVAVELHPEDGQALRRVFAGDPQANIRVEDGYAAMKALLPPKERRGLVLIDPPFEVPDEFRQAARALAQGLRRWPTGIFALWYPIKGTAEPFLAEVAGLGRPVLTAEFLLHPPTDRLRLNGSGLCVINPPWQIDQDLEALLALLTRHLGADGPSAVRWIRRE